jgi:hypothetical protein
MSAAPKNEETFPASRRRVKLGPMLVLLAAAATCIFKFPLWAPRIELKLEPVAITLESSAAYIAPLQFAQRYPLWIPTDGLDGASSNLELKEDGNLRLLRWLPVRECVSNICLLNCVLVQKTVSSDRTFEVLANVDKAVTCLLTSRRPQE